MQSARKAIVAAAAAAALQGCAGSGGGGDEGLKFAGDVVRCIYSFGRACGATQTGASTKQTNNASSPSPPSATGLPPPETTLTSWTELKANQPANATGPAISVPYRAPIPDDANAVQITWVGSPFTYDPLAAQPVSVQYDAQGKLLRYENFLQSDTFLNLDAAEQPGIDIVRDSVSGFEHFKIPFAGAEGSQIGLVANPYHLGWNYQSFGGWNNGGHVGAGNVGLQSFGAATPASAVPTSGSASFGGKLGGFYVSPAGEGSVAAGNLSVDVNFASRSLGFASSGTTLTRDFSSATAAPQLNVSGTLTYSPGANAFNGTLTNAGGTMSGTSNGQFYGPAAQELGGVFTLKSPTTVETFAGAYGAKR
jgi:hypothetical protein